jgi:transcriptional regulator GlxA family with amidase domain
MHSEAIYVSEVWGKRISAAEGFVSVDHDQFPPEPILGVPGLAGLPIIEQILPRDRNEKWYECSMRTAKRQIGFLVVSPFEQLDLVGPSAVFSYPRRAGLPAYEMHILSVTKGSTVKSSGGLSIGPSTHYADFKKPLDTLLVIGGPGSLVPPDQKLRVWLRARSKRTRRMGSICTGAFLLAEAGLLDGRRAATHWRFFGEFQKRFPNVQAERDPIFLKDGHIYTTAGVSAGIDLALSFVEEDHGYAAAMTVARELVLFLRRPGGQAQFSSVLDEQENVSDQAFRNLPSWVSANLTGDLSISTLARITSMSERTFARRFHEAFGTTPAVWVQMLRVEAVRSHLETSHFGLKEIAARAGFADTSSLRRAFRSHLYVSPLEYRERFHREAADSK